MNFTLNFRVFILVFFLSYSFYYTVVKIYIIIYSRAMKILKNKIQQSFFACVNCAHIYTMEMHQETSSLKNSPKPERTTCFKISQKFTNLWNFQDKSIIHKITFTIIGLIFAGFNTFILGFIGLILFRLSYYFIAGLLEWGP